MLQMMIMAMFTSGVEPYVYMLSGPGTFTSSDGNCAGFSLDVLMYLAGIQVGPGSL